MTSRGGPESWHIRADHLESGVLALLYPHRDRLHMAFMQRTEDGRVHGGQISFPGGRREPEDVDLVQTALREAEEEMGIKPDEVQVLGALTRLYIPPSNFMVYPTVGYSAQRPIFVPDPVEVAQVIELPLSELQDPQYRVQAPVRVRGDLNVKVPAFVVQGYTIWGATAMMLSELLTVIRELET
ncbi:MAG: CoA pyrophosphatase [Bacteroidetes bacterium]|nr:MAG: CoA pyrophosphatase [Bacteroidota bacterium]